MRELESHPKELAEIVGKKDFQGRLRFLSELRLWQESGRPNHSGWLAMSASGDLEKGVQDILKRGRMMVLSYFGMVEVRGDISLANVPRQVSRSAGAAGAKVAGQPNVETASQPTRRRVGISWTSLFAFILFLV